ncbi:MAG: phytoene desaturase family protein [Desulforhopalus sp.]
MKIPFLVIGGGLSGIAAAIRASRFTSDVLLLEKHSRLGGLNSYFYRDGLLYETGLHAITNYAEPKEKKAPLNRLLRQLKLPRDKLTLCQQHQSEILFCNCERLLFSNDFNLLEHEIANKFPTALDRFRSLLHFFEEFNPFAISPFRSARTFLTETLGDRLLADMLLLPLMFYGSSREDDMDLSQFAIMFRAIYLEGMSRPQGTVKDFLDMLVNHLQSLGGTIKKTSGVEKIVHHKGHAAGVILQSGEMIECDYLLSTIGHQETLKLLDMPTTVRAEQEGRLGFVENIYQLSEDKPAKLPRDKTIIFYNNGHELRYRQPPGFADFSSGVVCFPNNFNGLCNTSRREIRSTHLANYRQWHDIAKQQNQYRMQKKRTREQSRKWLEDIIGDFRTNILYENSFTPVTIKRYTSKIDGAIYGSPHKIKDGNIGYDNLFLAGTDQGFLGIVGSMLSGVSIVNQHILPKL